MTKGMKKGFLFKGLMIFLSLVFISLGVVFFGFMRIQWLVDDGLKEINLHMESIPYSIARYFHRINSLQEALSLNDPNSESLLENIRFTGLEIHRVLSVLDNYPLREPTSRREELLVEDFLELKSLVLRIGPVLIEDGDKILNQLETGGEVLEAYIQKIQEMNQDIWRLVDANNRLNDMGLRIIRDRFISFSQSLWIFLVFLVLVFLLGSIITIKSVLQTLKEKSNIQDKNKELEDSLSKLESTQESLLEAKKNAALGQMVSGVAHELNTPLGIMVTAHSGVEESLNEILSHLPEERMAAIFEYTKLLSQNLKKSVGLIQEFKRVWVSKGSTNPISFEVLDCIQKVFSGYREELERLEVTYEIHGNSGIQIQSFPEDFIQVISQLIENTLIHAFPQKIKKRRIMVIITGASEEVKIHYQDNGIGLDSVSKDRVFEPFFSTARNQGRAGLGLSILFNQVRHRLLGKVVLNSTEEKGLGFDLFLPERLI